MGALSGLIYLIHKFKLASLLENLFKGTFWACMILGAIATVMCFVSWISNNLKRAKIEWEKKSNIRSDKIL